jgi:hypothetical protein
MLKAFLVKGLLLFFCSNSRPVDFYRKNRRFCSCLS